METTESINARTRPLLYVLTLWSPMLLGFTAYESQLFLILDTKKDTFFSVPERSQLKNDVASGKCDSRARIVVHDEALNESANNKETKQPRATSAA